MFFYLNKSSSAQGTIEYLVIIGIVIVISLVVVGLLTNVFDPEGITTTTQQTSQLTREIALETVLINPDGTYTLNLKLNKSENITVDSIAVDGYTESFSSNNSLVISQEKVYPVLSEVSCEEGSTVTTSIIVFYTTRQGLQKTERFDNVKVPCQTHEITSSNVASRPSTINLFSPNRDKFIQNLNEEITFNYIPDNNFEIIKCELLINGEIIDQNTNILKNQINSFIINSNTKDYGEYNWNVRCTDQFTRTGQANTNRYFSIICDPPTFLFDGECISCQNNINGFFGGIGTSGDPYQICDWNQLDNIRNYLTSDFILLKDLSEEDLNYEYFNSGTGWDSIGEAESCEDPACTTDTTCESALGCNSTWRDTSYCDSDELKYEWFNSFCADSQTHCENSCDGAWVEEDWGLCMSSCYDILGETECNNESSCFWDPLYEYCDIDPMTSLCESLYTEGECVTDPMCWWDPWINPMCYLDDEENACQTNEYVCENTCYTGYSWNPQPATWEEISTPYCQDFEARCADQTSCERTFGCNSTWNNFDFSGNFNGNWNTIYDLTINNAATNERALFRKINSNEISNLNIKDFSIIGKDYSAPLAAWGENSDVTYVNTDGTLNGAYRVGGIIGYSTNMDFYRCSATGNYTITSTQFGGITSVPQGSTKIEECFTNISLTNSANLAYVGLLVGNSYSMSSQSIKNSYVKGHIQNNRTGTGSFSGAAPQSNNVIVNSYSVATSESNCFFGSNSTNSQTTNTFYDSTICINTSSGGVTGKTTTEMKAQSTFADAGWDFEEIWGMHSQINAGYPYLKWYE